MDGTDVANEGSWVYTATTGERPLAPASTATDTSRNCLKILSATEVGHTLCDANTVSRALFCEFEGN